MTSGAMEPTDDIEIRLSLVELADISNHSVRNLRAYLQLGVLHTGTREGREARFDESHIRRLDRVGHLRERGYTLSSIAELLSAEAADPSTTIPVARRLIDSWLAEPVSYATIGALEKAFPHLTDHPKLVEEAIRFDLASLAGSDLTVRNAETLRLATYLLECGMTTPELVEAFATLDPLLDDFVEHALGLFDKFRANADLNGAKALSFLLPQYLLTVGSLLTQRILEAATPTSEFAD